VGRGKELHPVPLPEKGLGTEGFSLASVLSLFFFFLTFLLVYNSSIGGFIVTFAYTCIMYPDLVHPVEVSPRIDGRQVVMWDPCLGAFSLVSSSARPACRPGGKGMQSQEPS
jgi:hypothetical protein